MGLVIMRVCVNIDDSCVVFEAFWADYNEENKCVDFFTLDDDLVQVKMSVREWSLENGILLNKGYINLCHYNAIYENE